MTIITIYSLFGDDIRILGFNSYADPTFYILTAIALSAFSIEIIFACFVKDEYWLGFYFWLDLISTISLIMDIGWFMDLVMGTGGSSASSA